jgi:hypothetical protein
VQWHGASLKVFDPLVEQLDPDTTVVCFDAPGTGGSTDSPLPYGFPCLAVVLGRVLRKVGIDPLGRIHDGIVHVTARFGYMEPPDIPRALHALDPTKTEGLIAIDDASYFLSKVELTKGSDPSMSAWRKNLFIATSYMSTDAAESFCLPRDRTLIMGSRIEV